MNRVVKRERTCGFVFEPTGLQLPPSQSQVRRPTPKSPTVQCPAQSQQRSLLPLPPLTQPSTLYSSPISTNGERIPQCDSPSHIAHKAGKPALASPAPPPTPGARTDTPVIAFLFCGRRSLFG